MVGDHHVRLTGSQSRLLGKAFLDQRAFAANAFTRGDGDLSPGCVGDTGLHVVTVTGLGGLDPFPQSLNLLAQFAHRGVPRPSGTGRLGEMEQRGVVVGGITAAYFVQARVIRAPLEQRNIGPVRQMVLDRVEYARHVAAGDLRLQRQGCGGDDHGFIRGLSVLEHRNQVGQRLARARARLDQQVFARIQRLGHLGGHETLSLSALTAHGGHGGVQELKRVLGSGQGFGADVRNVPPGLVNERVRHTYAGSAPGSGSSVSPDCAAPSRYGSSSGTRLPRTRTRRRVPSSVCSVRRISASWACSRETTSPWT